MSPEQIEVERKAFEAWLQSLGASDRGATLQKLDGQYLDARTRSAWQSWLARAEKAQRVRAQLQFAVDILSRIPALGSSAQVEAMRAVLKD